MTSTNFLVIDETQYYQEQQDCVNLSLWQFYYLFFCLLFTSILTVIYERQLEEQTKEMNGLEQRISVMGDELDALKETLGDLDNVVADLENEHAGLAFTNQKQKQSKLVRRETRFVMLD